MNNNIINLLNNINIFQTRKDSINKLYVSLQPIEQSIKVLSYNVYYRSMENTPNECKPNICTDNIIKVINTISNRYDFIALQEPSNIEVLDKYCPALKNMTKHVSKSLSGKIDLIVTYYDKNRWHEIFNGTANMSTDQDQRNMHIFIFSEEVIFINVHCAHYHTNLASMQTGINNTITKILNTYTGPNINQIFQNYRIIIAGDFNDDVKAMSNPFNITFNGIVRPLHLNPHYLDTCCILGNLKTDDMWHQHADNILDSRGQPSNIRIPSWTKPASDHAPVYAELLP